MKTLTNLLNLPQPIVDAVARDPYNKGASDVSVTGLLKPPRAVALEKLHESEIVEDAADRIYSLLGQIGHQILERSGNPNLVEQRMFHTMPDGTVISGQADLLKSDAGIFDITDYKLTSIFTTKDGVKIEWVQQLNMLRYLGNKNGMQMGALTIVAIYRDWSKRKAMREQGYPQKSVELIPVPVWTFEKTERFIIERIALHRAAALVLPECTDAERWASPTTYAIKKIGGKRAITGGICTSREEADLKLPAGHFVETRTGTSVRCESYCAAAPFCAFWQELRKLESGDVGEE